MLSCQRAERATHEGEIAVVLQAFLEIVACEQVIEITGLRRVRHFLELPEPAVPVVGVALEQLVEHRAVVDLGDRRIEVHGLAVEGLDRELVILGRLRVGVELGERVGNGEIGFLHRGVEQVAVAQLHPGRERLLELAFRGVRPAHA